MNRVIVLALALVTVVSSEETESTRESRVLPLFSIVTFPNSQCQSTSDTTTLGTCFSKTECSDKGGTVSGNCASGFGVCCTFVIDSSSGGTVTENCTYITNSGYPTAVTTASATTTYTVTPIQDDICQLRFDFTNLVLPLTSTTGACLGSFTVDGPGLNDPPTVCGTMTGQHLYMENGSSSTSTTVTIASGTGSTSRSWKVKISQIECSNIAKAREGCEQWFTGTAGTVKSPGFDGGSLLASQEMAYCFRKEKGYCSINYVTESASSSPDPFLMLTGTIPANTASSENQDCTMSRLIIPHDSVTSSATVFCGTYFNSVNDMTAGGTVTQAVPPFQMTLNSLASAGASTGFYLKYSQVPC